MKTTSTSGTGGHATIMAGVPATRVSTIEIDRPEEDEEGGAKQASGDVVTFSLSSEPPMVAEVGSTQ